LAEVDCGSVVGSDVSVEQIPDGFARHLRLINGNQVAARRVCLVDTPTIRAAVGPFSPCRISSKSSFFNVIGILFGP
jgi:hypothetical protein